MPELREKYQRSRKHAAGHWPGAQSLLIERLSVKIASLSPFALLPNHLGIGQLARIISEMTFRRAVQNFILLHTVQKTTFFSRPGLTNPCLVSLFPSHYSQKRPKLAYLSPKTLPVHINDSILHHNGKRIYVKILTGFFAKTAE